MSAKTRKAKPAAEPAPIVDAFFPAWKAEAVEALAIVHERAATVTRDGFWRRLYIRGFDPYEAAKAAAREYDATHNWAKRRW